MHARKNAFTLLELLVVIVIVAVLASVLIPQLTKMTLLSRNTQCISNLRQIGAALLSHAGEHNGLMPTAGAEIAYHAISADTGLPGWTEQLEPYLGTNRKIFVCPSSGPIIPNNAQYGYFLGCHATTVATGGFAALRVSLLAVPSKYILGGDIALGTMFSATDADKDDYAQNPAFATMTRIFHGKKVNLVFADGHVGTFAAFDRNAMTVRYGLRPDGTGYNYSDPN